MKRGLSICFLVLFILASLIGCSDSQFSTSFQLFQKKADIVQINRVIVSYSEGSKKPEIEVVESVDPSQTQLVFQLLRKIPCKNAGIHPNLHPKHECFQIIFQDKSFQLLAHDCNIYYSDDGSFLDNDLCTFDYGRFINTWDKGF